MDSTPSDLRFWASFNNRKRKSTSSSLLDHRTTINAVKSANSPTVECKYLLLATEICLLAKIFLHLPSSSFTPHFLPSCFFFHLRIPAGCDQNNIRRTTVGKVPACVNAMSQGSHGKKKWLKALCPMHFLHSIPCMGTINLASCPCNIVDHIIVHRIRPTNVLYKRSEGERMTLSSPLKVPLFSFLHS